MTRPIHPYGESRLRSLRRIAQLVLAGLVTAAAPAAAQEHNTVVGYGAGFISFGALNPGVAGSEVALDAGWLITAFGETWHVADGRMGARLSGGFTQRPLQLGTETRDIAAWMFDASLIARPMRPGPDSFIVPFISAGGGVVRYGLGRGGLLNYPESGVAYPGESEIQWAVVGGAGIDLTPASFRLGGTPLGVRLEVADHLVLRSPFRGLNDERLGPIHNVRFGVSLMGLGWF